MTIGRALLIATLLLLAACASAPQAPTPEVRQSLAPTGKLRFGMLSITPSHAVKDPVTGELKGVAYDVGKSFAARLGIPFEPVLYSAPTAFVEAGRKGEWDMGFLAHSPERAASFDFVASHLEIDYGFLVPAGSTIASLEAIDRPGVRVVVVEKGGPDIFLTGHLKQASLTRVPNGTAALDALKAGRADTWGAQKGTLFTIMGQLPGSKVLDGRPGAEEQFLALPKGRSHEAIRYARDLVREAKASGTVQQAIDRAGLRGASVPGN